MFYLKKTCFRYGKWLSHSRLGQDCPAVRSRSHLRLSREKSRSCSGRVWISWTHRSCHLSSQRRVQGWFRCRCGRKGWCGFLRPTTSLASNWPCSQGYETYRYCSYYSWGLIFRKMVALVLPPLKFLICRSQMDNYHLNFIINNGLTIEWSENSQKHNKTCDIDFIWLLVKVCKKIVVLQEQNVWETFF